MTPEYEIVDCKRKYCGIIARNLRFSHQSAYLKAGANVHRVMTERFLESAYRRAALIDGRPVAMWGVTGALMAPFGVVWFALTEEASKYHRAIVAESRRELSKIMSMKHELATNLMGEDLAAQRLAAFLGFHVAHDGSDGVCATSSQERRRLVRHFNENPELHMPIGETYLIAVGYHPDDEG